MARLIVNKHFTEHDKAASSFSTEQKYALGEIVICNDSSNPAIYIKDLNNNSVSIGDVKITVDDDVLGKNENGEIYTSLEMIWDSSDNQIKLFGKDREHLISSIDVFGESNIAERINAEVKDIIENNEEILVHIGERIDKIEDNMTENEAFILLDEKVNNVQEQVIDVLEIIEENEKVVANALNDIDERIIELTPRVEELNELKQIVEEGQAVTAASIYQMNERCYSIEDNANSISRDVDDLKAELAMIKKHLGL